MRSPAICLQLALERVDLRLLLRNELRNEPEAEEQKPENLEHHDQREERTVAEWRHEMQHTKDHRDDTDQQSDARHDETGHTEQHHRLAREKRVEADRDEIEHTEHDTRAPRVLRLAVATRVQCDVEFGYTEALGVGEDNEEAMPVVPQVDFLEHFATEPLHRIQIGYRHLEQPAVEAVVDPRDRALLVPSDLAARHDVPAFLELREVARDLVGGVLDVGVE